MSTMTNDTALRSRKIWKLACVYPPKTHGFVASLKAKLRYNECYSVCVTHTAVTVVQNAT